MHIHTQLEQVDTILESYREQIGSDFVGYKNHVYRVVNLCLSQGEFNAEQQLKIEIAGAFHDLGIWSASTLDYLSPSEALAAAYLKEQGLESWTPQITQMIQMHHGLCSCSGSAHALVEPFRRADIADFSLGLVSMGLNKQLIRRLKTQFPNAGFHQRLMQLGVKWTVRHPLNPLPMFRL